VKKTLPADWLEFVAKLEARAGQRPPEAPAKSRPLRRMTSPRQRLAETQTRNRIRAIYTKEFIPTPIAKQGTVFTTDLGGNCESKQTPHGKDTRERRGGSDK
jgi:hypothetical protein